MNVDAVVFDLDNTLCDRRSSFAKWVTKFICDFMQQDLTQHEIEEISKLLTLCDRDGYESKQKIFEYIEEKLPWKDKPDKESFVTYFYDTFPKCSIASDGMIEILDFLKKKDIPLGIITSGSDAMQNMKIKVLNIRKYFKSILISEIVGIDKPDKEIFQLSCKELNCNEKSTLYVGDNINKDAWGSYNAGMIPVWRKGYFDIGDEGLPQNTIVINDLIDLIAVID